MRDGLTRAIGLSNFNVSDMSEVMQVATIPPAINQCCMCVGNLDATAIAYAREQGITFQAYSPLGGADIGGKSILAIPQLKRIAASNNRTAAQVALRWLVQAGHPFVTATGKADYISEDLAIFDWALTEAEMATLDAISEPMPPHCRP